jgi:tetratricopeptide (TPR) repeat protein
MEDRMQESGPMSPTDDGPDQGSTTSEIHKSKVAPAAATAGAPRPKRAADPVIRRLTLAILVVVILWLGTVLSALMFGLINPAGPPRTQAERDIDYFTSLAQGGQANSRVYAQYIDTLIRAGQFSRAQQALDKALQAAKKDKSYLFAQQAQLLLARKDYAGTIPAADKAMAEAEKEYKAFVDANKAANRRAAAGAVIPESYAIAALAKAAALMTTKDYAGAIKTYDLYLKVHPTDSDILVERATAKVQVGDKKGAAADYRAALKYIPDYQPALDGLKQIGAAK